MPQVSAIHYETKVVIDDRYYTLDDAVDIYNALKKVLLDLGVRL